MATWGWEEARDNGPGSSTRPGANLPRLAPGCPQRPSAGAWLSLSSPWDSPSLC